MCLRVSWPFVGVVDHNYYNGDWRPSRATLGFTGEYWRSTGCRYPLHVYYNLLYYSYILYRGHCSFCSLCLSVYSVFLVLYFTVFLPSVVNTNVCSPRIRCMLIICLKLLRYDLNLTATTRINRLYRLNRSSAEMLVSMPSLMHQIGYFWRLFIRKVRGWSERHKVIRLVAALAARAPPITTSRHSLPMTQRGGSSAPSRTSVVYPGVVLTGGGTSPSTSPRVTIHVRSDTCLRTLHLLRALLIPLSCTSPTRLQHPVGSVSYMINKTARHPI